MPSPWITAGAQWTAPVPPSPARVRAAIAAVMSTAGEFARALWYQRAQDLGIRATGEYLRGIQDAELRLVSQRMTATELETVYELVNRAPHAAVVEHGHPAFSLPHAIDWGSFSGRIKRGKNGPFLHIAFRHAAYQNATQRAASGMTTATLKTMMPQEVYARVKRMSYTVATGGGPVTRSHLGSQVPTGALAFTPGMGWVVPQAGTKSGFGFAQQHVAANTYKAGGRFRDDLVSGPRMVSTSEGLVDWWRSARQVGGRTAQGGRLFNPAWKSSRFQGMFKGGSKGNAQYLTVRTITPESAGWNIPAQAGTGCARQVAAALNGGPGHQRFSDLLVQTAIDALRAGAP